MLWSLREISLPGRRSPRLDRITVQIPAGTTAVLGPSGAGKTSVLNVLVGFECASSGTITRHDPAEMLSPALFWSPPSQGLWPHLTIRQHLETVRPAHVETTSVDTILRDFDLVELQGIRPGSLSLGERSRLTVARGLASGARILVMDEPLAHVDSGRLNSYWAAIRAHCESTGTSVVFATHSPEVVLQEANHVLCLTEGRVCYAGLVSELYDRPATPELAAMLGPCNWIPIGEAGDWLTDFQTESLPGRGTSTLPISRSTNGSNESEPIAVCLRPERLQVEQVDAGTLKVVTARFVGSRGEVDLVDERHGRRRTFVHRPSGPRLRAGDHVLLKMLLVLLAVLISGCDDGSEPILNVKHETCWSMPPDGPRVPAPRGMTVSPDGEYLVLDNAGRLLVFDESGSVKRTWWMPEYSVGKPEGICVLKDGRIAVADTHYHRVVLFNREGQVVGKFGKLGTGPGDFVYPVSVIQDDKENLYVCEYGNFNDRAQKFRPDGTYVSQIGAYGTEDGQFQRPSGAAWFDGRIYIVDAFNNRVQVFNEDGKLIEILGKSDRISELYYPYDISVTERGDLYVVEYGAGRVSKFDCSGKLLGRYGHPGPGSAQFLTPWGMAVDHRGRVYVCDTGNRRIVELEF